MTDYEPFVDIVPIDPTPHSVLYFCECGASFVYIDNGKTTECPHCRRKLRENIKSQQPMKESEHHWTLYRLSGKCLHLSER